MLKPIPSFPLYYLDQCGSLWGFDTKTTHFYDQRTRIVPETIDGVQISGFTFGMDAGSILVIHRYTEEEDGKAVEHTDYYKQIGDVIQLSAPFTIPVKRKAARSGSWTIETPVISNVEVVYFYNNNRTFPGHGVTAGKGTMIATREHCYESAEMETGLLVNTERGLEFAGFGSIGLNVWWEAGSLWVLDGAK